MAGNEVNKALRLAKRGHDVVSTADHSKLALSCALRAQTHHEEIYDSFEDVEIHSQPYPFCRVRSSHVRSSVCGFAGTS